MMRNTIDSKVKSSLLVFFEGADTFAIRYADEHNLTKILFPANWKVYQRAAGFLRNEDMLSIATHLIAF